MRRSLALEKCEVFISVTPERAHRGRPRCYQATAIKQDFTQRCLAYNVLSRYSSAIVHRVSARCESKLEASEHYLRLLSFRVV